MSLVIGDVCSVPQADMPAHEHHVSSDSTIRRLSVTPKLSELRWAQTFNVVFGEVFNADFFCL